MQGLNPVPPYHQAAKTASIPVPGSTGGILVLALVVWVLVASESVWGDQNG